MSVLKCDYCGDLIDTDDDVEAYDEKRDKWACEYCRQQPMSGDVCLKCDGMGEWDEGPIHTWDRTAVSPEYRQVKCPDCNGTGKTP